MKKIFYAFGTIIISGAISVVMADLLKDYPACFAYLMAFGVTFLLCGYSIERLKTCWNEYGKLAKTVLLSSVSLLIFVLLFLCHGYDFRSLVMRENHSVKITEFGSTEIKLQNTNNLDIPKPQLNIASVVLSAEMEKESLRWSASTDHYAIIGNNGIGSFKLDPHLPIPEHHAFIVAFIRGKNIPGGISTYVWYTTSGGREWYDRHIETSKIDQNNPKKTDQKEMDGFVDAVLQCYSNNSQILWNKRAVEKCFS